MDRSFTVQLVTRGKTYIPIEGGRYISSTPSSAAMKAFSKACQLQNIKGTVTLHVTIRETSAQSAKKSFTYSVKRVKDERQVERNGKLITYKYSIKVKSMN